MNKRGNRIIFDNLGNIWMQTGEAISEQGSLEPWGEVNLDYIDIEYGAIDYNTHYIESVDIKANKPIIKQYEVIPTAEELKMQALEKKNADLAYELMMSKGGN